MTPNRPARRMLAATVAALLLVACGGGDQDARPSPTGGAAESPTVHPGVTVTAASGPPTSTATVPATALAQPTVLPSPSPTPTLGPHVDLDMDPAGNGCPNEGTDCTIGSVQECVSVPNVPGTTFEVDVIVSGLANGLTGFNYNIYFSDTTFIIMGQTHTDPAIDVLVRPIGSDPIELSQDVPNPPGSEPFSGSPHHVMVLNWGTVPTTPPFTQGVLGRYQLSVIEGASSGRSEVSLEPPPLSAYLDQDGSEYVVNPVARALVALGEACP